MPLLTKRGREGYLLIDHRAVQAPLSECCGVPAGTLYESATLMCCHCGVRVVLNPDRTRPRNHCRKCDRYVCDKPTCNFECVPIAKVLDDLQEAAARKTMQGEI